MIQSLDFTVAPDRKVIDALDAFRKKRNTSSYDLAGSVSDKEANEMIRLATSLRRDVENWIRNYSASPAEAGEMTGKIASSAAPLEQ